MGKSLTGSGDAAGESLASCRRFGLEQADPQALGLVDPPPIRLEPAVGDAEHDLPADDALDVDPVDHPLHGGENLVGELHLAHAQGPAPARVAEPAEEEAAHLPEGVEPEAARHHRIALEVAGEEPEVRPDIELGAHMAL